MFIMNDSGDESAVRTAKVRDRSKNEARRGSPKVPPPAARLSVNLSLKFKKYRKKTKRNSSGVPGYPRELFCQWSPGACGSLKMVRIAN
jgi:hypothetical protein